MQFELGTMLFQLGAFILLVLLVSKFASRPIINMMEKRQDHIKGEIKSAEATRQEAEGFLQQQKEILEQTRVEAKEIIARAKRQKEKEAEEIISQARQQAEQLVDNATTQINLEKEKALAELRDQVGVLSIQLTSKLLEKEVQADEQSTLVNRYLEEVGRVQ